MIRVNDLTFAYDNDPERIALEGITFSLEPETITAIIGLSGCGKSTLCQILCGIIPQCIGGNLSGQILIDDMDVRQAPLKNLCQKIGYVMQDPDRQIIAATVEDELAFGPENLALPPEEIRGRVDRSLELLGIEELALKNPAKLSGGQKQLTAVGAVLTLEPDILILDEPMSHVDERGRERMLDAIKKLRDAGKTLILVEHEYETLDFADQWLVLEEGRVKAFAPPAELMAKGALL